MVVNAAGKADKVSTDEEDDNKDIDWLVSHEQ